MKYKAVVINLEKDTDRLISMINLFSSLGIDFVRINAINGKEYLISDLAKSEYSEDIAMLKNKRILSPGELGCALSHKRSAQYLLSKNKEDSEIKYILICEDDINITDKKFKSILEKKIDINEKHLKKTGGLDWEYLQFDYQKPGLAWIQSWFNQVFTTYTLCSSFYLKSKHVLYSIYKLPFVFIYAFFEGLRNNIYRGNVSFYRDVYFAGCYLLHIDGAKKLLSLSNPIVYPADKIQNEAKKIKQLKVKYYCPLIVFQQRKTFTSNLRV